VLTEADHREKRSGLWSDAAHDVMIQLALLWTGDRVVGDRLTNRWPGSGVDMGRQTLDHRDYDLSGSGRRAGGAERRFFCSIYCTIALNVRHRPVGPGFFIGPLSLHFPVVSCS
jgi:hypothetical protein